MYEVMVAARHTDLEQMQKAYAQTKALVLAIDDLQWGDIDSASLLAALLRPGPPTLFIFKDLGPHCKDPQVTRQLRDLYFTPDDRTWNLVLVDAAELPPDVRRLTVPFRVGWPDSS